MLRNIGTTEVLLVVVLLIVVFGSSRLPEAARSIGRSARVLRREIDELHADRAEDLDQPEV